MHGVEKWLRARSLRSRPVSRIAAAQGWPGVLSNTSWDAPRALEVDELGVWTPEGLIRTGPDNGPLVIPLSSLFFNRPSQVPHAELDSMLRGSARGALAPASLGSERCPHLSGGWASRPVSPSRTRVGRNHPSAAAARLWSMRRRCGIRPARHDRAGRHLCPQVGAVRPRRDSNPTYGLDAIASP